MAANCSKFEGGTRALPQPEDDNVGAVLMGERPGNPGRASTVKASGRLAEVPVGEAMLGAAVINPLGLPLDGKGEIATSETG